MKDFMSLYQNLVERCFNSCCNDFTSKAVSSKEVSRDRRWLILTLAHLLSARFADDGVRALQTECVNICSDKFLKHSERVGLRFSEANAEMMARR